MKTNFLGPAYKSRSARLSAQTRVNLLFEPPAPGSSGDGMFFQRPGLKLWGTIGAGPFRGGRRFHGYGWVVSGTKLYRISTSGSSTEVGSVPGSGRVSIEANDTQIVVMHSEGWNVVTVSTLAYSTVTDAPKTAQGCMLGTRIYFPNDNGTYGWTEVDQAATLDALNFASAESRTDPVIACFSDKRELIIFGEDSTEWYLETGDPDQPVQRTAVSEYGLCSKFSIAAEDNTIFYLGQNEDGDPRVFKVVGNSPVGISDFAIEDDLKRYDNLSSAIGITYQYDGHAIYLLTIPGHVTWAYDISTQQWSQFAYRNTVSNALDPFPSSFHFKLGGKHLIGDMSTNEVYELDKDTYTENGDPLYWERTFTHLENAGKNIRFNRLEVMAEMGVGLDGAPALGTDPLMILRWSDDGGLSFPSYRELRFGKIGEYRNRAVTHRLGMSRHRVFQLSGADPVKARLYGVDLSAEAMQT